MRILSTITAGGQPIKWLGLYIIIILSVLSCDIGVILPLDNNKLSYDVVLSENCMVKIGCMYFHGSHYILFDLEGEYVINPDSLRFSISDDNIELLKLSPYSGTEIYKKNNTYIKNRTIAVRLRYELKDKSQEIKQPSVLFVLPSNFIMKNDKRVLGDSIRIVLNRPKR